MRIIRYLVINLVLIAITAWVCLQARETKRLSEQNVKHNLHYQFLLSTRKTIDGWINSYEAHK